jgi:hypothetical protein
MNHQMRVVPVCGLALSGLLTTGCFLEVREHPRPTPPEAPTGSLTVRWTIDDRSDPRACSRYGRGATDFELLLYSDNHQVAEEYAPCEQFGLTVDLTPGTYKGYTTLVDRNGDPVTSTLPLEALAIVKDAGLAIDVDFPTTSFLPGGGAR